MKRMRSSSKRLLSGAVISACRGFSLLSAIFLLVVLAGLGVAIIKVSTAQHTSSALDVLGAQAYQAARAGIEWALYQKLQSPSSNTYCNDPAASSTTTSFALPSGPTSSPSTLGKFTVTVTCTLTQYPTTATTPMSVVSITAAGNEATVTTTAAHGLLDGYQISMSGASAAAYNGTFTVTKVLSTTTFKYSLTSTPGPSSLGSFTARDQSLDRRQIKAVACNQPTGGGVCPNPSTKIDYVERELQVEF